MPHATQPNDEYFFGPTYRNILILLIGIFRLEKKDNHIT